MTRAIMLLFAALAATLHPAPARTAGPPGSTRSTPAPNTQHPTPRPAPGYIGAVPAEDDAARKERHRRVAARRAGTAVMCHRGASAFAPENTIEAYAAAMDFGADGCEIDLRRTQDGVLVLFHDDMLDHLTGGFGTVNQLTYYELLCLEPRLRYGSAPKGSRPPTLAAVLALARQRGMLLHLDVKEPGLETDIARALDAADTWDHVVAVNTATAPALVSHPKVRLLRYKGPGLYEGRLDLEPEAVRAQIARPGEMIMVDDPRVAARELRRTPYRPVPLPAGIRRKWAPASAPAPAAGGPLVPEVHLRPLREASAETLRQLLAPGSLEERSTTDGSPAYERERTARILERAFAARRLGEIGARSPEVVSCLEYQVRHRSLHRDWMYHGLDAATAISALGTLKSVASVPLLTGTFLRVDPELRKVVDPRFAANPLGWTDFRTKMMILPALGDLPCPESKQFLQDYLAMDPAKARELAPLLWEDAARALLRQDLSQPEIESLLRSEKTAVRGAAILECLDNPTRRRTAALRAAAPWALELPRGYPRR